MKLRLRNSSVLVVLTALTMLPALSQAETFNVDPSHSSVQFKVRHLVSKVTGNFRQFEGSISYDPASPAGSSVEFTVQAASIDTASEQRDGHLKSPDFFNVEKFPTLSFKSSKVKKTGESSLEVTGEFTLHGVTKTVTAPVDILGVMDGPWGKVAGFETTFKINRKEFGIVWNKALDRGGFTLGDEVEVNLIIEAPLAKKEEAPTEEAG